MPKRILRNLRLNAIAAVTQPCQEGAKAMIIKSRDGPAPAPPAAKASGLALAVSKYIDDDAGAHTFLEVLRENQFSEEIWPMTSALSQSIRSIVGDTSITPAERDAKIAASVDQFLTAVRALDLPPSGGETESEKAERLFRETISKRTDPMPNPTVESLTADLATAKGQIVTLTAEVATEKGRADTAVTALETEKTAHVATTTKLAEATDETIKVGEQEFKKSVVGEAAFALAKASAVEAARARVEKRAEVEFGHVAGTPAEKADVLLAVEAMPEATGKAALAIIESAEKLAVAGFSRLGSTGIETPTAKAAREAFTEKVQAIKTRDGCDEATAMSKARREHSDLFDAYQDAGADA